MEKQRKKSERRAKKSYISHCRLKDKKLKQKKFKERNVMKER